MPWAAARLRRETWGDSPADQMVRGEDAGRRAEVAKMFQTFAANLDRMPDVDPENRPALRVRCLRAVEYFGGLLAGGGAPGIPRKTRHQDVLFFFND